MGDFYNQLQVNSHVWKAEGGPVKEEEESLDDGDLACINAILNSFSKTKLHSKNASNPEFKILTPEGALTRAPAPTMTPPKFNQKFLPGTCTIKN